LSPTDPTIRYTPRPGTTPEAEFNALAAIYKFVLFDSQASKGGSYDLTSDPAAQIENGPRNTEQEKT
jgi:hypothetical protein